MRTTSASRYYSFTAQNKKVANETITAECVNLPLGVGVYDVKNKLDSVKTFSNLVASFATDIL